MRDLRVFFLILFFTITFYGIAQNSWSLEECIRYGLEHNISVKQTALRQQLAEIDHNQSKYNLLPSVSGNLSAGKSIGNTINPATNAFSATSSSFISPSVNASVPLFTGLQQINSIKKTKYDLDAALLELKSTKNSIALNIANLYLQALQSKELLQAAKYQAELIDKQLKRTEILVENGVLAKGTLYDIKAQAAKAELSVVKTQNDKDLALFKLKQLLLIKPEESFDILATKDIKEPNVEVYDAAQVYQGAVSALPQAKQADIKLKSAEKQIDIIKGSFYPTLSLSYGLNTSFVNNVKDYNYATITPIIGVVDGSSTYVRSLSAQTIPISENGTRSIQNQFKDYLSHRITLNLSVPLFSKMQNFSNLKTAKVNHQIQQLTNENTLNQLREETYTAVMNYSNAQKTYFANKENSIAYKLAADYAAEKFQSGVINALDYSTAVTNYNNAESELLRSKYDFMFRKMIVDFYLGRPFKSTN